MVICLERGANGPADATAIPLSLASLKSRMVYLTGAGLPRLSWKSFYLMLLSPRDGDFGLWCL